MENNNIYDDSINIDRINSNPIFVIARDIISNDKLIKKLIYKSNQIKKQEKELVLNRIIYVRDNSHINSVPYEDCIYFIGLILHQHADSIKKVKNVLITLEQKGKQIYESKFE